MALGICIGKTRAHHKKVFPDNWVPMKKPTCFGRTGERDFLRTKTRAIAPLAAPRVATVVVMTAFIICCFFLIAFVFLLTTHLRSRVRFRSLPGQV